MSLKPILNHPHHLKIDLNIVVLKSSYLFLIKKNPKDNFTYSLYYNINVTTMQLGCLELIILKRNFAAQAARTKFRWKI